MGIVYGHPPETCAACAKPIGTVAYDAFHPHDRVWGWFCKACFVRSSAKLGVGRGQQYDLQFTGKWVQTAGGRTTSHVS